VKTTRDNSLKRIDPRIRKCSLWSVAHNFARNTTIVALSLSLGVHWIALQSIAWTTMLMVNARHTCLSEALAKTFDGAHPCALCYAVADGHKPEKKSELPGSLGKVDLICTTRGVKLLPPWVTFDFPFETYSVPELSFSPPSPPPRSPAA